MRMAVRDPGDCTVGRLLAIAPSPCDPEHAGGLLTDVATLSEQEILLFEIGGERYGLPSVDVRELVRAVTIVPLPRAPAIVEGLINLRGRIVPVLDVRSRFRVPAKPLEPSDHFIIASVGT